MLENQFYDDYQSPLGYRALKNGYDTYGVDHSQFTTREEVEYQDKRIKREEELMQQQRNMGITGNYVQYGTNFWNTSPENNYGFGGSEDENNNLNQKNNYLLPQKPSNNPNWGNKTEKELNKYLANYTYPTKTNTGIFAPFYDMTRNYNDMRNIDLVGSDNFFHCKANYEAAKRGNWGAGVGKAISTGREIYGLVTRDPLSDIRKDWNANQMGWNGAKQGLSLKDACPTDPKVYFNPEYYK